MSLYPVANRMSLPRLELVMMALSETVLAIRAEVVDQVLMTLIFYGQWRWFDSTKSVDAPYSFH